MSHASLLASIFFIVKSTNELIPTRITITLTMCASTLYGEHAGLRSVFSQKMIGKQKPTIGLLVAPMTVIASPMLGMQTAARKQSDTMEKVQRRFSPRVI